MCVCVCFFILERRENRRKIMMTITNDDDDDDDHDDFILHYDFWKQTKVTPVVSWISLNAKPKPKTQMKWKNKRTNQRTNQHHPRNVINFTQRTKCKQWFEYKHAVFWHRSNNSIESWTNECNNSGNLWTVGWLTNDWAVWLSLITDTVIEWDFVFSCFDKIEIASEPF